MARAPQPRIGQEPSALKQQGIPLGTVMLGSLVAMLPIISTAPLMPPFGLMMLLAWRSLHRDLWPVWVPLGLGLFDDLFSGQPLGSAMLLWTICFLIMDATDRRFVWRDFWQEWLLASGMIALSLFGGLAIANMTGGGTHAALILPQLLLSVLLFPIVVRWCARLDQWRF